jgi:hypothetical protein
MRRLRSPTSNQAITAATAPVLALPLHLPQQKSMLIRLQSRRGGYPPTALLADARLTSDNCAPNFQSILLSMLGLLGRGVLALADSVEESVDWQLNVVAGWKVVNCELRDVIHSSLPPL